MLDQVVSMVEFFSSGQGSNPTRNISFCRIISFRRHFGARRLAQRTQNGALMAHFARKHQARDGAFAHHGQSLGRSLTESVHVQQRYTCFQRCYACVQQLVPNVQWHTMSSTSGFATCCMCATGAWMMQV